MPGLNLGTALRANGKLIEAETAFWTASKARPDWAEAHFNIGVLYLDADPYPGIDTSARLNRAIASFNKYKGMAIAAGAVDTGKPGDDVARVAGELLVPERASRVLLRGGET